MTRSVVCCYTEVYFYKYSEIFLCPVNALDFEVSKVRLPHFVGKLCNGSLDSRVSASK